MSYHKLQIGWTVLRNGKPTGQRETRYGSASNVTPVYDTITKARGKATRIGRTYEDIVEVFIEVEKPEGGSR